MNSKKSSLVKERINLGDQLPVATLIIDLYGVTIDGPNPFIFSSYLNFQSFLVALLYKDQ
jgi:hypothetical protein